MFVAILALPAIFITYFAMQCEAITHRFIIASSAVGCAVVLVGMIEAVPAWLASVAAYTVKLLSLTYFIAIVAYTAEVFPPRIRNTAVGLCTCVGRLGAISAPLIFELSHDQSKSFDTFIWAVFSLIVVVAATTHVCLEHETKGRGFLDVQNEKTALLHSG